MNQKLKVIDKKHKNKKIEFEFCKVCNLNHDQGQTHKYFPNHKKSLSTFLSRFQAKLTDVRFFLKNPTTLHPDLASHNRIWCVFCDIDIVESGSYFACANAISHLASTEHLKKLKHFLWKYGGGMDRVDTFRILDADVVKWEKKCAILKSDASLSSNGLQGVQVGPLNDIQNKLNNENINILENKNFDALKSNVSNGVMPLHYYTNEHQISNSRFSAVANVGPFMRDAISSLPVDACSSTSLCNSSDLIVNWNSLHSLPCYRMRCTSNLHNGELCQVYQGERVIQEVSSLQGTHVPAAAPPMAIGNVHSGAPPPWFDATEENQLNSQPKPISSSVSLANKSGKSHKLNPKRVGAAWAERRKKEIEMEKRGEIVKSDCDASWLPNFGRVWQSGSRKESRKEFEKEKQKFPNVESHSVIPITIQPYISKRMRNDASAQHSGGMQMNDGCGDNHTSE